jgi:hypothetical protein
MSRLITDLDVMTGRVTSPLLLSAGVLITPAARDRAIANGLVIVERDGTVVGAAPSAAPATEQPANRTAALPMTQPTAQPTPAMGAGAPPAGARAPRPAQAKASCGCPSADRAPKTPIARVADRPCSCGGGCGGNCAQPALPDGLHLVRVDGGRVAWTRPVSGETPSTPPR